MQIADTIDFKKYIHTIMMRLINENALEISKKNINNEMYINIRPPSWFLELEENVQEIVYSNMQIQMSNILKDKTFSFN